MVLIEKHFLCVAGGGKVRRLFHSLLRKQPARVFPNHQGRDFHKLDDAENLLPRIRFFDEPFWTEKSESTLFDLNLEFVTDSAEDACGLIEQTAGKLLGWSSYGSDFSGAHLGWQETGECSAVFKKSPGFSIRFPATSSL